MNMSKYVCISSFQSICHGKQLGIHVSAKQGVILLWHRFFSFTYINPYCTYFKTHGGSMLSLLISVNFLLFIGWFNICLQTNDLTFSGIQIMLIIQRKRRSKWNKLWIPSTKTKPQECENFELVLISITVIFVHIFLPDFCHGISYAYRDDEREDDERKLMKDITKCVKSFGKCTVEQTATLMAWSEKNELPIDKYRKKVQRDLDQDE